jgi:hypothetical protein
MFLKDPGARLDYRVDWTERLPSGAIIQSSSWTSSPAGLDLSGESLAGPVTLVWVAGGLPGHRYRLVNHVQLSDGSADERTVLLRVEER